VLTTLLHCYHGISTAQQEAERAKYVVSKAMQEKEAIIVKAAGEAESAALVGKVRGRNGKERWCVAGGGMCFLRCGSVERAEVVMHDVG